MSVKSKFFRIAAGWLAVIVGVILLPLPGPGLLVIFGGLTLLSKDSEWARGLMERLRKAVGREKKDK